MRKKKKEEEKVLEHVSAKRWKYMAMEFFFSEVVIKRMDKNGHVKVHVYKIDLEDSHKAARRIVMLSFLFQLDITRRFSYAWGKRHQLPSGENNG
jgi:hypothetical protein